MEQPSASTRLAGAVRDLASEVVSALRGGDHPGVVCAPAGIVEDDKLGIAAVRVLGADVLLPSIMSRRRPEGLDVRILRQALTAFPPGADASRATAWSHWAMARSLRALDPPVPHPADDEPDASWLDTAPWQALTHQVSLLAALAVPGGDCGVLRALARRPHDVARGFVRAVRRRDWLQAAGAGRWLAVLDDVPPSLGLDTGLEFIQHMDGADPRVALHVSAAQLLRAGAPR
ncbi:hypothetical protein POF50_004140 [Streptomyces sp. SL13]|uniref:Uncharacterized protein n=1 Tax=Streptantibioticus silvisoli TaxID=2705255 RepID=A0AA90H045_9ACTN|nr:hypothetical protein [Streptantibioticus silvisoli]MDI5968543.1 hypothetical protein [Streptantibioticus silvisoli]